MHIDLQHPTLYYGLFFSLAHLTIWSILFYYGYRHKYPLLQWLLIIVTGFISFTIGTHLLTIDIQKVLIDGIWSAGKGKSLISGLLLAVPCLLLIKNLLKFNYDVFKPYAFAIPIGIAIQRLGCFIGGCCYGKLTDVPWGISYSHGFNAHFMQWATGIIPTTEGISLAVHPVQLYEAMLCILAFILIIIINKKSWFRGPLIYVSLLFYSIIRFTTEFFRANEAHTIGINEFWRLNTVQWILLYVVLISLYILLKNNKNNFQLTFSLSKKTGLIEYAWYIVLFILVLVTPGFYSPLERLLLGIVFIPLSILVFWEFFKSITFPEFRIASASLCAIGIFLMSQKSPIVETDAVIKRNKYHEISIGGYTGSNSLTHYTEDCEGNKTEDLGFKENYYVMGVGYKYVNELSDEKKFTIGFGASYGKLKEHVEDMAYDYNQEMYMIAPFVQYDLKTIGFGVGLVAGDISLFRPYDYERPFTVFSRYSVLPQAHLRIGNLQKIWGEFNYDYRFPNIAPTNEYELLLGIRGQQGHLVRFGTSAYNAVVVRPQFYINDHLAIEPYVGLMGPLFSEHYAKRMGYQGGINLHYRIHN